MVESSPLRPPFGDDSARSPQKALAYVPALDGLRALSVAAVLLYHAEIADVGGGFLGVEVFFVLSGYLITSLLLVEWDREGGIALAAFWERRARRLLPALAFACSGAVIAAAVLAPDLVERTERDAVATLFFIANWVFVARSESYLFALDRVPLLRHLWSLGVEEQFYAIWPVAFLAARRWVSPRLIAVSTVLAAGASALWLAYLYDPATDPSSLYFRTDTRLSGILLGAAFATALPSTHGATRRPPAVRVVARNLLGLMGLGVLVWAFVTARDAGPFVYRGGFVVVDLATLAVITAAMIDRGLVARALSWRCFTAVGRRSYALYLWHGPVFALTRPGLDNDLDAPSALVLRLVLTGLAAEISYRCIERGARRGAMRGESARSKAQGGPRRWLTRVLALGLSASIAVCGIDALHRHAGATSPALAAPLPRAAPLPPLVPLQDFAATTQLAPLPSNAPQDPASPALPLAPHPSLPSAPVENPAAPVLADPQATVGRARSTEATPSDPPFVAPGAEPANGDEADVTMLAASRHRRRNVEERPSPPRQPPPVGLHGVKTLTVLTDSVTLGAKGSLPHALPDWSVEFVGRPALMIKQVVPEFLRERKSLGSVVVIGVGYNSLFEKERRHFDRWAAQWDREAEALLAEVKARGAQEIVWVTLREPAPEVVGDSGKVQYERYAWYFPYVNERIRALSVRHPEVRIADWEARASHITGITCDLIHLNTPGARLMARTIVEAMLGTSPEGGGVAAPAPSEAASGSP